MLSPKSSDKSNSTPEFNTKWLIDHVLLNKSYNLEENSDASSDSVDDNIKSENENLPPWR